MFSKQLIYCNCCGNAMYEEIPKVIGKEFKCCSMECVREMQWREALSIMGKEYYTKWANSHLQDRKRMTKMIDKNKNKTDVQTYYAELCDQHAEKLRVAGDIRGSVGASECAELIRRTSEKNHDQTKKE